MVQGMFDSARQAMAGSTPRLLSQTIYTFDWEEKTFTISGDGLIVGSANLSGAGNALSKSRRWRDGACANGEWRLMA